MLNVDSLTTKTRVLTSHAADSALAAVLERLFFVWISGVAALTFLGALLLAVIGVIGWMQLLYVYSAVTGVTLILAGLLYLSRRDQ
jgi:hypothetical protein